jgi:aspartate aminotransferase-like enzyme
MYRRPYLQIPGPTNIPEPVLNALNHAAINHRGAEFAHLMRNNVQGLQQVFQTENDILIFPCSGSGGLEAAIVNLFSPGDKVLAVNMGVFSQRFGQIAKNYGADVTFIEVEWGKAVTAADYRQVLQADTEHQYKAVLVTHNETASGVVVDVASVRKLLDELQHPALLLVDAVSSLAIIDLPTDELRIDVVVSASQKGLMLPGGLAIIAVGPKAWAAHEHSTMPKWYWNFTALRKRMAIGQMPYTPAVNLFFGMEASLQLLQEEGLQNVFKRHQKNAEAMRSGMQAIGLGLLVQEPESRSAAVTAVRLPEGISFPALGQAMEELGVIIGGGLQQLAGKIFRVGHLGMLHEMEVVAVLGALEMSLTKLDYPVKLGTATGAAMASYLNS